MRYEKQILDAFERVGFTPRDNQVEHIDRVLIAFLDEKVKNVILSAPTGSGKSIIGVVVADVVHQIKYPGIEAGASFLLSATNVLLDQYYRTFVAEDAPEDDRFHIIKGAGNYTCDALSTFEEPQSAESCSFTLFSKQGMDETIARYCGACEYKQSRAKVPFTRHLILNYAYYFINRMYSTYPLPKRTVCVFDEVHLLNDLFVEHNAIYFSEKRLHSFAEEVSEALKLGHTDVFKNLKVVREHLVAGKIKDENYQTYLRTLHGTYNFISGTAKREAERNFRSQGTYLKLSKLSKKYENLACKIDDLFIFKYPHVFEYKPKDLKNQQNEHEVSVKPIFVGEMFEALDNADHNLLMSATINSSYVKWTMTLPGTTKHIRLPSQFPPENKKIVFFKTQPLSYETMKDPEIIGKLCAAASQIVNHHAERGERGLILAPSFALVRVIAETLRRANGRYKVFEHVQGEKLADRLEEFKAHKAGPAVLLTPAGFEGIDLAGDVSRYQVICKMPFGSLGDRRIEHIRNMYPEIFTLLALQKVVQGAGRSVRSMTDYATTYCLDSHIKRSWQSYQNEWKDEFSTSYMSELY